MIKTVVFDICGVVWNDQSTKSEFYDGLGHIFNEDQPSVENDFLEVYKPLEYGKLTLMDWFKQKNINYTQEQIDKFIGDILQNDKFIKNINIEVVEIIKDLQKQSKVGCLSNIEYYFKNTFYDNIAPLFDFALFSYEIGHRKPDPEAYLEIFKHVDCQPQEVIFIDDKERNLVPARALGINCIHFTSSQDLKNQLNKVLK